MQYSKQWKTTRRIIFTGILFRIFESSKLYNDKHSRHFLHVHLLGLTIHPIKEAIGYDWKHCARKEAFRFRERLDHKPSDIWQAQADLFKPTIHAVVENRDKMDLWTIHLDSIWTKSKIHLITIWIAVRQPLALTDVTGRRISFVGIQPIGPIMRIIALLGESPFEPSKVGVLEWKRRVYDTAAVWLRWSKVIASFQRETTIDEKRETITNKIKKRENTRSREITKTKQIIHRSQKYKTKKQQTKNSNP